jgi:uncharacterized metal-binding protein YceD (DUF177 family)
VNTSEFVVSLTDLERGPKQVTWPISATWLARALEGTEAVPGDRPGELEIEFSKNGREVMARGQLSVDVTMPCSRTLEPVPVEVASEVFLLLTPATTLDVGARRPRRVDRESPRDAREKGTTGKAAEKSTHSKGRPSGKQSGGGAGWVEDPVLTEQDAARDTYSGEQIVLDRFVREFILLELPMFPMQKGLPSEEPATIAASGVEPSAERPIDPRLLPLVEIASRLRNKE